MVGVLSIENACVLCNQNTIGKSLIGQNGIVHVCSRCRIIYDAKMEGLFIGRFQPFHRGHLAVIREMAKEVKLLHIVVGSSQYKNTWENPFSAEERTDMIKLALRAESINNFDVTAVPDIVWHERYVDHIKTFVPYFHIAFFGDNKRLEALFAGEGFKTKAYPRIGGLNSTGIRKRIAISQQEWKNMVPSPVVYYIAKIGGIERIKQLYQAVF